MNVSISLATSRSSVAASTPGRYVRVIRQDVRSMHAYAIQPSEGLVKLDAMENPFRLPPALQQELSDLIPLSPDEIEQR